MYLSKTPDATYSLLSPILLHPNLFSNTRLSLYVNRLTAGKQLLYWTVNPTFLNN